MNKPEFKLCPSCGAECDPRFDRCWICQQEMTREPVVVHAEAVKASPAQANNVAFLVVTILLVGIAVVIGVGLAMQEMGLAILYAIVAAPALVATVVSLGMRTATGKVTWFNWILTVLATLMISTVATVCLILLAIISALAALAAFCNECFQMTQ